jgi:hypothetical protein
MKPKGRRTRVRYQPVNLKYSWYFISRQVPNWNVFSFSSDYAARGSAGIRAFRLHVVGVVLRKLSLGAKSATILDNALILDCKHFSRAKEQKFRLELEPQHLAVNLVRQLFLPHIPFGFSPSP